jgi:hypothetical protein
VPLSRHELAIALVAAAWSTVALKNAPPVTARLGAVPVTAAPVVSEDALALGRLDDDGGRRRLDPTDTR